MFSRHIVFLALISSGLAAQRGLYINGAEASLRIDSLSYVSVDGEFVNQNCDPVSRVRVNGALYVSGSVTNNDSLEFEAGTNSSAGKSRICFYSSSTFPAGHNAIVNGTVPLKLWHVVIDKPGGGITLHSDVLSLDTVNFVSGRIFLNGRKWRLLDPVGAVSVMNHPWIKNETSSARFSGINNLDTGKIIYNTIYPQAAFFNPANLGIQVLGTLDHGSAVEFERGVRTQQVGKAGGANYYAVRSPAYGLASNTVVLRHFASDAEYYPPAYFQMPMAAFYVAGIGNNVWTQLSPYAAGPYVFGGVTQSTMAVSLSMLNNPNVALDGKMIRFTLGDPLCTIKPGSELHDDSLYLCSGNSYTLNAGNNGSVPNTSLRYQWNSTPVSYAQLLAVTPNQHYQRFKVQIIDVKGCITRDSVVIAPGRPSPQFKYVNHLNACIGDSVTIKDTVEIGAGTYALNMYFSDATSQDSVGNIVRKKFNAPGQYSVDLFAQSSNGCTSVLTITNIQVYPLPTVDFEYSHDCVSDAVTFTSMAISNHTSLSISRLLWKFGSSLTQTATSPSYIYPGAGHYSVELTATSSFGCTDSATGNVLIHPRNIAGFMKSNNCLGVSNSFTNITACNTGSCNYRWSFGNGDSSNLMQPQVTFTSAGGRTVKLHVTGPVGCPDSAEALVFVHPLPSAGFSLSQVSACVNTPVYFSNTTTISSGSIAAYTWDLGNGQTPVSVNSAASYSTAGLFQVRLAAVSDSGCVDSVSHPFTSLPQPSALFHANNVCFGFQSEFLSNSSGNGLYHTWYPAPGLSKGTGSVTSMKYTYALPGIYSPTLVVTDTNSCSDTISAQAVVKSVPVIDLGGSIKTCGYSYTLDALNPGCYYSWFPGKQTGQVIVAQTSGFYSVIVTATNGCAASGSVVLTLNGEVDPFLGNDTTVCGGLVLDAGYPGSVFSWASGQATQKIFAASSGMYAVHVTDMNQCSGSDSIYISVLPLPQVALPADTTMCTPRNGWVINCMHNAASVGWNTGASGDTIHIDKDGMYWVQAVSGDGCVNYDTTVVTFLPAPFLQLGPDTGSCNFIELDAQNLGCTYQWSDGSTDQYRRVTVSSLVNVVVTNTLSGCKQSDTIAITIYPPAQVLLGDDTAVCAGRPFVLHAADKGEGVLWLSGETTPTLAVNVSGVYGAEVTNVYGCRATDFLSVTVLPSPTVELGDDLRYICGDRPLDVSSQFTSGNVWNSATGFFSERQTISVVTPGKYWLTVTAGQCSAIDTIVIGHTSNTIQAMFLASTLDTVNKPVKFVNLSSPAPTGQTWWFGDGASSSEFSPVHAYLLPADFSVTLEVTNGFCTDRITKALSVLFRERGAVPENRRGPLALEELLLFPNPAASALTCVAHLSAKANITILVTDLNGRSVFDHTISGTSLFSGNISLAGLANGVYVLHLRASSEQGVAQRSARFVKAD